MLATRRIMWFCKSSRIARQRQVRGRLDFDAPVAIEPARCFLAGRFQVPYPGWVIEHPRVSGRVSCGGDLVIGGLEARPRRQRLRGPDANPSPWQRVARLSAAAERMFYCPAQAGLFMPPAQLGSPSDIAIPIMLHGSCIKFIHLK